MSLKRCLDNLFLFASTQKQSLPFYFAQIKTQYLYIFLSNQSKKDSIIAFINEKHRRIWLCYRHAHSRTTFDMGCKLFFLFWQSCFGKADTTIHRKQYY